MKTGNNKSTVKAAMKRKSDGEDMETSKKLKLKQYRGNLVKTYRLFEVINPNIRQEHVDAMRQTPFFNFWQPFLSGQVTQQQLSKSDQVLREIVARYSKRDGGFKFGEKILKLTSKDVELIFGLKSGDVVLPVDNAADKPKSGFASRLEALNGSKNNMNVDDVNDELSKLVQRRGETDLVDFIKLMCAHSIYTVFDSHSGNTVPYWILDLVDDLDRVNRIAWSQYVVEKLQTSLDDGYLAPDSVIGCVLLLGYVMLEHTRLVKRVKDDAIPRFASWKMNDFKMTFLYMDEISLSEQVDVAPLRETEAELQLYRRADNTNASNISLIEANPGRSNTETLDVCGNSGMRAIVENEVVPLRIAGFSPRMHVGEGRCKVARAQSYRDYGVIQGENEWLHTRVSNLEKLLEAEKIEREKEKKWMRKRCEAAEEKYNSEVKRREELEMLLDNANVEIDVHCYTQMYSANKELSAMKVDIDNLRNELAAKNDETSLVVFASPKLDDVENNVPSPVIVELDDVENNDPSPVLVESPKLDKFEKKEASPAVASSEPVESDETEEDQVTIPRGLIPNPRKRPPNKKYSEHLDLAIAATTWSSGGRTLKDKKSYEVAMFLTDSDFEILQLIYYQSPSDMLGVVMTVPKAPHKVMRFDDLFDILTNDKLSSTYMDCYLEMLADYVSSAKLRNKFRRRSSPPVNRVGPRVCFMPANIWSFIEGGWATGLDEINEKLDEHLQDPFDHIVVTLNADIKNADQEVVQSLHWTLLVLNVKKKKWSFYNSLYVLGTVDRHRQKAVIIAKYIEGYLEHGRDMDAWSITRRVAVSGCVTPKQLPNTNDCGIIVCYVLKQLIEGNKHMGRFYQVRLFAFRANLITWGLHGFM